MAKVNIAPIHPKTHEGGRAAIISSEQELRRSVLSCLLWEKTFYEDGQDIVARIAELAQHVPLEVVAAMAIEAREKMHLRHVPLWLALAMVHRNAKSRIVSQTITRIIQRADELSELLALYWLKGKTPIAHSLQRGLAEAFPKFGAYALAKYNRDGVVKLRDVMFLTHPKPKDEEQAAVWKQLAEGTLPTPDTWEVRLSTGKDKKESFETLLREGHLGYLALLRNLRNMVQAGVDESLVFTVLLKGAKQSKALPFRFVAAARAVPQWEPQIEAAMFEAVSEHAKLLGKTILLVDVSGSMNEKLTDKSDLNRIDAASALAVLLREVSEDVRVYTFSDDLVHVALRRGMALIDAISQSQSHRNTYLGAALQKLYDAIGSIGRLIVVTDEQAYDAVPAPIGKGYLVNVAPYKNGVGYGAWTHIDGFSEAIVNYIMASEDCGVKVIEAPKKMEEKM